MRCGAGLDHGAGRGMMVRKRYSLPDGIGKSVGVTEAEGKEEFSVDFCVTDSTSDVSASTSNGDWKIIHSELLNISASFFQEVSAFNLLYNT